MTHDKLDALIEIDRTIGNIKNVLSDMKRSYWVTIKTPNYEIPLSSYLYDEFKQWLEEKLDESEKYIEEA